MSARRGSGTAWAAAAAVFLGLFGMGASVLFAMGWWLDFSDVPERSDMILVLCGQEYSRAAYAVRLFKEGYAPEVWLARVRVPHSIALVNSLGIRVLNEDEVFEQVLLRQGVPRGRLRRFGAGVVSTTGEARAFREAASPAGRSVLVVTSRYHARRAKMILRRFLPGTKVRVCADPSGRIPRRWWSDRELAKAGVLEAFKTVHFLFTGASVSEVPGT